MRAFRAVIVIALILISIVAVPAIGAPMTKEPSPSVTAPGAPSSSESPGTIEISNDNATRYLAINASRINTTTIDTVTLDAGGVVVIGTREIVRTVNTEKFGATIRNASDKRAVIDAALDRVANRTDELRARQTAAIEAYNNDKLSTQAFLRELAIIDEKARQLRTYADNVRDEIPLLDDDRIAVGNRISYLQRELNMLTGPVRTNIQSALRGDSSGPQRYFVRTSAHGVVLATVGEDEYLREVYLAGARTVPNTTGFENLRQARDFVEKSYPVATNRSGSSEKAYEKNGLYWFRHKSSSGEKLSIGVNKSSGKVFHEVQVKYLGDDGTVPGPTNKSERYILTTRITHPGGYMRIQVSNRSNGDNRNGTVSINNETIGFTGEEEEGLYILQPAKPTTINVTINGETLSVTTGQASQLPPPPSNPAPDSSSVVDSSSRYNYWAKARDVRG
jgi:hypothetical protein